MLWIWWWFRVKKCFFPQCSLMWYSWNENRRTLILDPGLEMTFAFSKLWFILWFYKTSLEFRLWQKVFHKTRFWAKTSFFFRHQRNHNFEKVIFSMHIRWIFVWKVLANCKVKIKFLQNAYLRPSPCTQEWTPEDPCQDPLPSPGFTSSSFRYHQIHLPTHLLRSTQAKHRLSRENLFEQHSLIKTLAKVSIDVC